VFEIHCTDDHEDTFICRIGLHDIVYGCLLITAFFCELSPAISIADVWAPDLEFSETHINVSEMTQKGRLRPMTICLFQLVSLIRVCVRKNQFVLVFHGAGGPHEGTGESYLWLLANVSVCPPFSPDDELFQCPSPSDPSSVECGCPETSLARWGSRSVMRPWQHQPLGLLRYCLRDVSRSFWFGRVHLQTGCQHQPACDVRHKRDCNTSDDNGTDTSASGKF
jgi:hypothetical protein